MIANWLPKLLAWLGVPFFFGGVWNSFTQPYEDTTLWLFIIAIVLFLLAHIAKCHFEDRTGKALEADEDD